MATATERKFTSLRKRLDQMGYRQPLCIEALPLTEKLFGDLLHTTESLKNAKQQLGKHTEQKCVWEQDVEPYKNDNARVIKENNELHQKIMKVKENAERRIREYETKMRRLEHENMDVKFLNTQYLQRLRVQEKDLDRMKVKMMELQEKNLHAVIQTPGGKKRHIPFRRQRMEIDCVVPESSVRGGTVGNGDTVLPTPDPYVADLLHVVDQRMAELQAKVEQEEKENNSLQDSLHSIRLQVENRETEIERLTRMLKGGRPAEALAAEGARLSNERMVAHLNVQVDFLQQAARDLEEKLAASETNKKQLEGRVGELRAKNDKICSELEEIGQLVKQIESEREDNDTSFKGQIKKLEGEKVRLLEAHGEVESVLCGVELKKAELLQDNQRMAQMLASSEGDRKDVVSLLERVACERMDFQRHDKPFKEKEDILQVRIAQLEAQVATIPSSSMELHPPQAAAEVRRLRKERNDLKDAISNFETELLQIQMDTKTLADDRDNFKLLYEQVSQELSWAKELTRSSSSLSVGVAVLRRIEGERDHALLELKQLRSENKSLQGRLKVLQSTQHSDLSSLENTLAELRAEHDKACEENESLTGRLQSSKELLASLRIELEGATKDLTTANAERVMYQNKVAQLHALMEASEKTKQALNKEVREKEGYVEQTHATTAALNIKIAKLESKVNTKEAKVVELSHSLATLDQARDRLVTEANRKDETIAILRREVEEKKVQLDKEQLGVAQLEAEMSQLNESKREREKEMIKQEARLAETRRQQQDSTEQALSLSTQMRVLRDDLAAMTHENRTVHLELERACRERTSLELKCEELGVGLEQYKRIASVLEQEKAEAVQSCHNVCQQLDRLEAELRQQQDGCGHAQQEIHTLHQEKQRLEAMVESHVQELHAFHAYEQQLSTMTHALSKLEGSLRQEQEEKNALLTDVGAVRELCLMLERSKESLTVQLSTQSLHYDQTQCQLGELKAEVDLLHSKLQAERVRVEQLQTLVSVERQKEFVAHMTGKERDEELQHLRQLMTNLEADRLALADQTRRLRADTAVQSEALGRLKSELASEKFQKEHMKQQLNVQCSSLALLTSPKLHASTCMPSPPSHDSLATTSPQPVLPHEPALSSPNTTPLSPPQLPPDSQEGDGMLSRERHTFQNISAEVANNLLKISNLSRSTSSSH